MATKTKDIEKIEVKPLNEKVFKVTVEGESLLMNKKDEQVESLLKDYFKGGPRNKRISGNKKEQSLKEIVEGKIYHTEDDKVGFPASGFKTGMVMVAPKLNIYKNSITGAIQILGNILPIKHKKQTVHEAWGKTAGMNKTPKMCIRPCFHNWSCELTIKYNADVITAEQIVNLLNWAGFHQGLGDWRPACGGSFGIYKVKAS